MQSKKNAIFYYNTIEKRKIAFKKKMYWRKNRGVLYFILFKKKKDEYFENDYSVGFVHIIYGDNTISNKTGLIQNHELFKKLANQTKT